MDSTPGTYRGIPNSDEFVADIDACVEVRCTALHNLGDVDAIIAGYMLVADAPGYAEPETLVALLQRHLDHGHVGRPLATFHALQQGTDAPMLLLVSLKQSFSTRHSMIYLWSSPRDASPPYHRLD